MLRGCGQLRGAKVTCSGEGQFSVWPSTCVHLTIGRGDKGYDGGEGQWGGDGGGGVVIVSVHF